MNGVHLSLKVFKLDEIHILVLIKSSIIFLNLFYILVLVCVFYYFRTNFQIIPYSSCLSLSSILGARAQVFIISKLETLGSRNVMLTALQVMVDQ